ncbi:MAG: 50S ribosomal protein L10 [Patescibacteria group bacterium]
MARSKTSKQDILKILDDKIKTSTSVVFANLGGLKVSQADAVRKGARKEQVSVTMAKKTLLKRAFTEAGYDEINIKSLEGEIAACFGSGDEVAPAKILARFAKEFERCTLLGGVMLKEEGDARYLDLVRVRQLASIPSREELLAKTVSTLANPLRGMVGVLGGTLRSLLYTLNAIGQSKA